MSVTRAGVPTGAEATDLRPGDPKVVAAILGWALLSVALPAYLVASIDNVGRSDAWVVTLAVMIWAGARLSLLVANGQPRLFDLFFWLFTYIFMGLAPTVQIRSESIPVTTAGMDPGLDMPTAGVVVLGLAIYEVGRALAIVRESHAAIATTRVASPTPVRSALSGVRTVVLGFVGACISLYFLAQLGPALLLGSRDAAAAARAAAWPDPAVRTIISAGALFPVLIAGGALAQLRFTAPTAALRRGSLIGLLGCLVLIFSVVSPVNSARYTLGTVVFAVAVYLGAVRTAFRVRVTMVVTFVAFLLVFPVADAFRREEGGSVARRGFFAEYQANPDYDSFWQIANAYAYWREGLIEPLRQLTGSLLFWVPRAYWPGKPTDTGSLLAQYRGYTLENLSAPLWAEALVNAGIVGVCVVFVVLGFALRRLDSKCLPAFRAGGVWALVGAVFPVFMTILLRGSLLQATGTLVISIACVLFVRDAVPSPSGQRVYSDTS